MITCLRYTINTKPTDYARYFQNTFVWLTYENETMRVSLREREIREILLWGLVGAAISTVPVLGSNDSA